MGRRAFPEIRRAYAAARPNDPPPEAPEPEPVPPPPPPRPPVAPAAVVRRTVGALALAGELITDERQIAQVKGYTGDECRDCGSFSMVRNGTCLKCENCGSTTGCS